ncbi:MAG TPA: rhodanese-like domain-containing protein [Lachnospiraceae bacterium]|nr:rhodanese-like domain-containing protein [Lachnospiraceae bacterium]
MTDLTAFVTTETFVEIIRSEYCKLNECEINLTNFMRQGVHKGWLQKGSLQAETLLDRKNAAWIVHEFLEKECGEADEEDFSPAKRLKDLYDCHTCVNHVAQVYVKGIMSKKQSSFGMRDPITVEEARQIASRIFGKEKRTPPKKDDFVVRGYKLSLPEAMTKKEKNHKTVLIDVRPRREYDEKHLEGAISIPLNEILKNPYQVAENTFTPLLLYCENAYQSEIAANCVMESGYWDVGYFAFI